MTRRQFLKLAALAAASPSALVGAKMPEPGKFIGLPVFERLISLVRKEGWRSLPIGERVGKIGLALAGTPYVAHTLELDDRLEIPCVNLEGLDCVTFFENCLAFARMLTGRVHTPQAMLDELVRTRYRGGLCQGYTSRLHYTSDWFFDNFKKRVVADITAATGQSTRFEKRIDFMSKNPGRYRQLKNAPDLVRQIEARERIINQRSIIHVPKERIKNVEAALRTGDIIAITTSIAGIDCSHTGLCYRDEGDALRFLHASQTRGKVLLDVTLSDYVNSQQANLGIMIARPL